MRALAPVAMAAAKSDFCMLLGFGLVVLGLVFLGLAVLGLVVGAAAAR